MEEMVSQLSVMVEDLKVERRYALSTLAGRRIREAADAVEHASVLVSVAVNVGESDARRRMDDTLLSMVTLRGQAVADTVEAENVTEVTVKGASTSQAPWSGGWGRKDRDEAVAATVEAEAVSQNEIARWSIRCETDPALWWTNEYGWVESKDHADTFSMKEFATLNTPDDGIWIRLVPVPEDVTAEDAIDVEYTIDHGEGDYMYYDYD